MAIVAILVGVSGCYRTRTAATAPAAQNEIERRQWFLMGGLVPLSEPAAAECGPAGMATSDSRVSGSDILISSGLTVAGGLVGAAMCPLAKEPTDAEATGYASCVGVAATLLPSFLQSRTVSYRCAER
ncbi:hypothetical protein [Sorangium sp. So ce1078]|uniref:hypothetical protein n=1 Tax=Sorangium sp. So ce1078 TaxID=3133329 RepID=UPI003F61E192